MSVLGLDIGGANLKAAHADGTARSVGFPLWRTPELLAQQLDELIGSFAPCTHLAVTMTGELADCFATKAEGVRAIVEATRRAGGNRLLGIWSTAGRFLTPAEAIAQPMLVAAANWHALATLVAQQQAPATGVLIDIGSTTTDLIPFRVGRPYSMGLTDLGRMQSQELIYAGVERTPLSAISSVIPFRGNPVRVAAELFATSRDVYLLRGDLPEDPDDCATADGRPATRAAARERIGRMLCADREELTLDEVEQLAEAWVDAQLQLTRSALEAVLNRLNEPCAVVVTSGAGEFLAKRVVASIAALAGAHCWSWRNHYGPQQATAACAAAVMYLASWNRLDFSSLVSPGVHAGVNAPSQRN